MLLNLLLLTASLLQACSATPTGEDLQIPLGWKQRSEADALLETSNLQRDDVPVPPLTVTPLIISGPPENRVDFIFFSDGYLEEEHDKFLADATRLAQDISTNQTFHTMRPLMNFWAAFTPSNESGLGVDEPKDTAFGLFRFGTQLRAVVCGKPDVARAACDAAGVSRCDYPIMLANDPLYGGLEGEFVTITASALNGALVLRHELGHNLLHAGEEYDGIEADGYYGINTAKNLSEPTPWEQWMSDPHNTVSHRRVERVDMPMQEYPWSLLNTTTAWSINFTSSGNYSSHLVRFSLSGLPEATDVRVELDGIDLGWVPKEGINVDRWQYDILQNSSLIAGQHQLKFTLLNEKRQGIAQLCSCEILEYGNEKEFISEPGYIGLFPTFSEASTVATYRPTNEECLMRVVTSPNFCKVCTEQIWLTMLSNNTLIDSVEQGCKKSGHESWDRTFNATLVPLAQFRDKDHSSGVKESYSISWLKDGKPLNEFTGKTLVKIDDEKAIGSYTLRVKYSTEEVRVDKDNVLQSEYAFEVNATCKIFCVTSISRWPGLKNISRIVVFGDSFSAGSSTRKWVLLPKAARSLSAHSQTSQIDYLCNENANSVLKLPVYNYARAGDTVQDDLEDQIASFADQNGLSPCPEGEKRYNTLYVLWIGINDCSQTAVDDMEELIERIFECADTIYLDFKARNFLFIDLPPIDRSPGAIESNSVEDVSQACKIWNAALAHQCKEWAAGTPGANVLLWSSHSALTDILDDPEEYDFQEYDVEEAGGAIWEDDLHLTSEVHQILAEKLHDSFKSLPSIPRAAEPAVDDGAKSKRRSSACDADPNDLVHK